MLERCIRVIGQWLDDAHAIAEEQLSDESYRSPEKFLEDVHNHKEDIEAMSNLKQELEKQRE
jgi:hypothetical protein